MLQVNEKNMEIVVGWSGKQMLGLTALTMSMQGRKKKNKQQKEFGRYKIYFNDIDTIANHVNCKCGLNL